MPHIHEKIDITAEALVVYKNKVLLRMHDKYKIWLGVGGHVELDEDPNQAVIREVKEEVGLDIKLVALQNLFNAEVPDYRELVPPIFMNRHKINEKHEHVTLWFFAISNTDRIVQPAGMQSECKWFSLEDLDDLKYGIRDSIIFYAKAALKELSNVQ